MPGRNIIWCQTSDPSVIAKLKGKRYTHVILTALHLHCQNGNYWIDLNDTHIQDISKDYWTKVGELQSAGVKVTALVSGAGNGTFQCIKNHQEKAAAALLALTDKPYNLQGFDLDWEPAKGAPPYDSNLMASFTNRLARPGLVITHAPITRLLKTYTSTFWKTVGNNLAWINVQWYGEPKLFDAYADFVDGKVSGSPIDPNRVVIGATVKLADVPYIDICHLMKTVTEILKQPGGARFGGVAGWEFTLTLNPNDPKSFNWDTCIAAALQAQTQCVACKNP